MYKIGFTIPNFNTAGSGKALFRIAKSLNRELFESHIICKNSEGEFFKTVKNSGMPIHVLDYQPQARPITTFMKASWEISRKLKATGIDLIHSFHYNNNYPEAVASRLAGIPWVFTKKNMMWGSDGANSWKIRSALAARIVIQNTDMKREFYPNSTKTVLIARGIDTENFKSTAPKTEIRKQFNTPVHARILCTVANLQPVKGVDILIDSFDSISNDYQDWYLWIVGDEMTNHGKELVERASQVLSKDKIRFIGKQINVVDYLNHAEIFVLPTRATGEGSPVSLLEAMANGKVVIGSDVPGIRDQLNTFPEHLFEAENGSDLAKKLKLFMSASKDENRQLGEQFMCYVNENFSLVAEVEKHEELYKQVLK